MAHDSLTEARELALAAEDATVVALSGVALLKLAVAMQYWEAFRDRFAEADVYAKAAEFLTVEVETLQLGGDGAVAQGDVATAVATYRRAVERLSAYDNNLTRYLTRRLDSHVRRQLASHADEPRVQALFEALAPG